jgi:2-keto-4-pentenoate hydratase/2-oxohepta-3-ene-1,7-dioic acid hydratase in catechol pathway
VKLVTYRYANNTTIGAVRADQTIVDLTAVAPDMLSLIDLGTAGLARAQALVAAAAGGGPRLDDVTLLAPIPTPRRNVMCLGRNYAEHAEESSRAWGQAHALPELPVIFTKATTAVNGPYDDIPYDAAVSTSIDYEAELAIIIGRGGKNISREAAPDHVFGYTVLNDVTARDLQRGHQQFFKGKSLDGSCPMGPWIVTAAALPDPHNLRICCRVNGETRQDGATRQMIYNVADVIYHLSRGMTLLPGDVIATGTPSGVGFARTPPQFLQPGDIVECEIEKIGVIRNRIGGV